MKIMQALAIALLSLTLINCSKTSTPPPTPKGTLAFINQSAYPYQVSVNGKILIAFQPGKTTQTMQHNAGNVIIKVIQQEGYILYPTEKTFMETLKAGGTVAITYP